MQRVRRALLDEGVQNPERLELDLVVAWVTASSSRKLNAQFRGKSNATDVLSFRTTEDQLGELVLCPSVLQKQARQAGHSLRQEAALMLLHGMLHLLGYDHEKSQKQALRMSRLQERIFFQLLPAAARSGTVAGCPLPQKPTT